MVSASLDGTLKVWDVVSGRNVRTVKGRAQRFLRIALSGDGGTAISTAEAKAGDRDSLYQVTTWDATTWRRLGTPTSQPPKIWDAAMNENGRLAVSASEDGTVKLWEVSGGTTLATFTCDGSARCCAFIDDERIIAGDESGRVHFLRVEGPTQKHRTK